MNGGGHVYESAVHKNNKSSTLTNCVPTWSPSCVTSLRSFVARKDRSHLLVIKIVYLK